MVVFCDMCIWNNYIGETNVPESFEAAEVRNTEFGKAYVCPEGHLISKVRADFMVEV